MAEAVIDDLGLFLAATAREAFAWGERDCLLWCADWWRWRTGTDPAAAHRGTYADQRGARRLIRQAGGIAAFGALLGGVETPTPRRGDVGLVMVAYFRRGRRLISGPVGAICLKESLWMHRTARGFDAGGFPVVRAWTIHG